MSTSATSKLLEISNLQLCFHTIYGTLYALNGVSLTINKNEAWGLVGETGCGKSVTASSILRLVECPPGEYLSGKIMFEGHNLLEASDKELKQIRGRKIAVIFQEPRIALNPVIPVGDQIIDVIREHQGLKKKEASAITVDLFKEVALPDPKDILKSYPFELSGGMCQRIMIAMAMSCNPELLIADEPTSALDVTIQSQILSLISELREEKKLTLMMISHDLGVIAEVCDMIAIMYAGNIVEKGSTHEIFDNPLHPYTQNLFKCIPTMTTKPGKLQEISGSVLDLMSPPKGCVFRPRCPFAYEQCEIEKPPSYAFESHSVECHLYKEAADDSQ